MDAISLSSRLYVTHSWASIPGIHTFVELCRRDIRDVEHVRARLVEMYVTHAGVSAPVSNERGSPSTVNNTDRAPEP